MPKETSGEAPRKVLRSAENQKLVGKFRLPPKPTQDLIPSGSVLASTEEEKAHPHWERKLITLLIRDRPSLDVLREWCECAAEELGILGETDAWQVYQWLETYRPDAVRTYCRKKKSSLHKQSLEIARFVRLTRVAPLRVIKEGLEATRTVVIDEENGITIQEPDHRVRGMFADRAIKIFGMEAPQKVDIDQGEEVRALNRVDLLAKIVELQSRFGLHSGVAKLARGEMPEIEGEIVTIPDGLAVSEEKDQPVIEAGRQPNAE